MIERPKSSLGEPAREGSVFTDCTRHAGSPAGAVQTPAARSASVADAKFVMMDRAHPRDDGQLFKQPPFMNRLGFGALRHRKPVKAQRSFNDGMLLLSFAGTN